MHKKTVEITLAAIITIAAVVVFSMTLVHAAFYAPDSEVSVPSSTTLSAAHPKVPQAQPSAQPSRLLIPSLNIDAHVQYVGIAKSGHMAVPNNYTDVGWYRNGPAAGQEGSAVMDGHVDNGFDLPGVFKHLNEIKVGDDIYVETNAGQKLHFTVTDVELYPYQNVPTDKVFYSEDGASHLNLITCDGAWVSGQKTYDHRLVVFTTL
jgi:sortase A